jgi:hypothetical protein
MANLQNEVPRRSWMPLEIMAAVTVFVVMVATGALMSGQIG